MDELAARVAAVGGVVRPVRDADGDELAELVGGVFAEYPGCVLDADGLDADLFAWATHLAEHDGAGWVVRDATARLVACVGVAPPAAPPSAGGVPTVELKRLYVHAAARQQGLGAALVRRVEAWGADHGAAAVVLWSDTRFADAHRLYERLGYARTGRQRDLHDPSDTTEDEFVRRLDGGLS